MCAISLSQTPTLVLDPTALIAGLVAGGELNHCTCLFQLLAAAKIGPVVPVVLFNPLSWSRSDFAAIPVNRVDLYVLDSANKTIASQVRTGFVSPRM